MPNPKRRHSKTRQRKRRTHYKASAPSLATCSNCGEPILMHRVCPNCGFYRGKQAMEVS
ncbi:MAG: 50S ribosomal protein L32 [Bacteroidetes bacterium]|nr:50S ribosomal protein L32 [Bacteroidota bacterium]